MPLVPVRSPVGPRSVADQMETQAASQKKKIGLDRKRGEWSHLKLRLNLLGLKPEEIRA